MKRHTRCARQVRRAFAQVVAAFGPAARDTLFGENEGKHLYEIAAMRELCPAGAVLDVGGGLGVNLLTLAHMGHEGGLHLIDRFEEYTDDNRMGSAAAGLQVLRDAGVEAVSQDFVAETCLPYDDGRFDLATCFDVIEHLPCNPLSLFAEVRRVLRPGGTFMVGVPNAVSTTKRVKLLLGRHPYTDFSEWCDARFFGHFREYTPGECRRLVERAGLCHVHTDLVCEPSRTRARRGYWKGFHRGWRPRQVGMRWLLRLDLLVDALFPRLRPTVYEFAQAPRPASAAEGGH